MLVIHTLPLLSYFVNIMNIAVFKVIYYHPVIEAVESDLLFGIFKYLKIIIIIIIIIIIMIITTTMV